MASTKKKFEDYYVDFEDLDFDEEFEDDISSSISEPNLDEMEEPEQLYCTCKMPETGDMIQCENENCKSGQWFHYDCVGISATKFPEGKWYCEGCISQKEGRYIFPV